MFKNNNNATQPPKVGESLAVARTATAIGRKHFCLGTPKEKES